MIDPNHTMNLHAQTDERIASLNARIAELERDKLELGGMVKDMTAETYKLVNETIALRAELARAREFLQRENEADLAAIEEWNKRTRGKYPWKPEHKAMVALRERQALVAALAPTAETGMAE